MQRRYLLLLAVILMMFGCYWGFGVIQNKLMADKVNDYLLKSKSFLVQDYFKDAKVVCALAPYFTATQKIPEIREHLSTKDLGKINRKVNAFVEDSHWDLLIINQDKTYRIYRIGLQSLPDFKRYKCVDDKTHKLEIYPVRQVGRGMSFDLR